VVLKEHPDGREVRPAAKVASFDQNWTEDFRRCLFFTVAVGLGNYILLHAYSSAVSSAATQGGPP